MKTVSPIHDRPVRSRKRPRHVKVAITLDPDELRQVEALRRRLDTTRSAAIREALRFWFAREQEEEDERRYVESYRNFPEPPAEMKAIVEAGYDAIRALEWN